LLGKVKGNNNKSTNTKVAKKIKPLAAAANNNSNKNTIRKIRI